MSAKIEEQHAGGSAEGMLTGDMTALQANWRRLRDRAGGAECAAVVKADAYGLGIAAVVPALYRAGCRTFFVAHLQEAMQVRQMTSEAIVYVLNGLLPATSPAYLEFNLRPVLGSPEEVDEWTTFCRAVGKRLPAAIHVDTGMNRLGLTVPQGLALKGDNRLSDFRVSLLMSHFVGAEDPDNPMNARQIEAFRAVRQVMPKVPASLANSSGIFLPQAPHFDLVRPGYALYGGNPTPGRANPMNPVVRLEVPIVQVRTIEPGESVGYNGAWTADGRRRIATISAGYADGYPRSASRTDAIVKSGQDAGAALVNGRLCPFVGRVSMDLIAIDVTNVPEDDVQRGDRVTLIGGELTIDEVGRRAGTIGYEILTSLGRRYMRKYNLEAPG